MEIKVRDKIKVSGPQEVAELMYDVLALEPELDLEKEHFWLLGLRANNGIKFIELISLGTLNASLVHPREVFRPAVIKAVASVIVVHNHPSGTTSPSNEDRGITKRLREAGKLMDIPLLDHIIIGRESGDSWYSFKEEGLIDD